MYAYIEHSWFRREYNVFIYDKIPGGQMHARVGDDGRFVFDKRVTEGTANLEPTFSIPDDALEALVAAAADKLPADGSMAKHLKDATTVRDRLLSMIELKGL